MTIFLHCEGITDFVVIPLLIKNACNMPNVNIQWIKRNELNNFRIHPKQGDRITKHYKLITALTGIALKNECKNIAYHQDADGNYSEVYEAITSRFQSLKEGGFHCLCIVPKETIESWLLADEKAYPSIPDKPKLPSKPEELWGRRRDKNSNHPYNYFVRVLDQFRLPDNRDTYTQIAKKTSIEVLKFRCHESFGQFYRDLQEFGDNLTG